MTSFFLSSEGFDIQFPVNIPLKIFLMGQKVK